MSSKDKDKGNNKVTSIDGLTPKQEKFIQGVLSGMTASESYRNSYSTKNMKDSSIWREASVLMSHPKVSQRVKAGFKRKEQYGVSTALSLRQFVTDQLIKEAKDINNNESARIRALEMIGKISEVALFTDRVETTNNNRTSDEIKLELEQKIHELFAGNN
tara:strand:+ start:919 stop:1398 length:480 start_codon:yes stop_codon:yes gene_type:complete